MDSKVSDFFSKLENFSFFDRLFSWKFIKKQSKEIFETCKALEASAEDSEYANSKLMEKCDRMENSLTEASNQIAKDRITLTQNQADISRLTEAENRSAVHIKSLEKDMENTKLRAEDVNKKNTELEKEKSRYKEADYNSSIALNNVNKELELERLDKARLTQQINELTKSITEYKENEKKRIEDYMANIGRINTLKDQLDGDRQKLADEKEAEYKKKLEQMKLKWVVHEEDTELTLRGICSRYQMEYIDKENVPFKGKPDNTVKIADEYVIFDAKSPQTDDLSNFPSYIKQQTEAVKKYIKEAGVKKEIFLVVPSNTIDLIDDTFFNMADYNVYVVTLDSLQPIILALRKVEDYEFAEQLSPEDRENICRVIGKFSHLTKRRIQIDSYFCNEAMTVLGNCNSLPLDLVDKVADFEKSDKLNPPQEKRAKQITEAELGKHLKVIKQDTVAHGMVPAEVSRLPMYVGDEDNAIQQETVTEGKSSERAKPKKKR